MQKRSVADDCMQYINMQVKHVEVPSSYLIPKTFPEWASLVIKGPAILETVEFPRVPRDAS